jgi:hypothetical protein
MTTGKSGSSGIIYLRRLLFDMLFFTNLLAFKIAWLSSVIGGGTDMPWIGPAAVSVALLLHFRAAQKPLEEILLVLICAVIGTSFDSFLVASGLVAYKAGMFSSYIAPYWIITLWMLFATTLNVSFRWLRGKVLLSALIGCLGGPASYLAGQALGGIVLVDKTGALIALAVGWAVIMPLLMRLAENLDGMPGPRRKWLREQSR